MPRPFVPAGTPRRWQRARRCRISHVSLSITLDLDHHAVSGQVTHTVELPPCASPTRLLELDQHDLEIGSVQVDGSDAAFSRNQDRLAIMLPEGPGPFQVRVAFARQQPVKGLYFVDADPGRGRRSMAWTQGAVEEHSWWFPCFDDPNNRSTFALRIRHRSPLMAFANGVCEGREDRGDGWAVTTWIQDRPHVLYLLNVAVGEFASTPQEGGPVPIAHHLPAGQEAHALAMFRATPFALRWLADFTQVPYPYKRYGHVVVHDFMWGGMENAGLTTITDRRIASAATMAEEAWDCDDLVIHEAAHQWFGDLVTMKAWKDLWLNESFATWLEALATAAWRAHALGAVEADEAACELWRNRGVYLEQEAERYSRALVTDRYVDADELFDRVAYEKGSLILHHLSRHLGLDRMRHALKSYLEDHPEGLVETADLRQALEATTGESLDWFFAQWLERPGHPRLAVEWSHDPAASRLMVTIRQKQAIADSGTIDADAVYRLPLILAWKSGGNTRRQTLDLSKAEERLVLACPAAPDWVVLDPDGDLLCAEIEEGGPCASLAARLHDADLPAIARARAAQALGKIHPSPSAMDVLRSHLADTTPRVVLMESAKALAAMRTAPAVICLADAAAKLTDPRRKRLVADALGRMTGAVGAAQALERWAATEPVAMTVGTILSARGATEVPGATAILRPFLARESWDQRIREGALRGLGASGESAAIEVLLPWLNDDRAPDNLRRAAAEALAELGRRHLLARTRIRLALERLIDHPRCFVRAAAATALGRLGDPEALGALGTALAREASGMVARIQRDARDELTAIAAQERSHADLAKQVDDLKGLVERLTARLAQAEERLGASPTTDRQA